MYVPADRELSTVTTLSLESVTVYTGVPVTGVSPVTTPSSV